MARNEGKDVQQVYDCLELDISDMDVRGRTFVRRVIEGYENLDLSSCVFYGCYPPQIGNGLCIRPEQSTEDLLLDEKDFSDLDLRGLKLDTLVFRRADFRGSDLRNARFQDLEVEESDFRNVKGYNIEMHDCEFNNCKFSDSDFSGSELDFKAIGCNFSSCDFEHASLYGTSFESCDLRHSTLSDGGNFQNCDLSYSDFKNLYDFPFVVDCTIKGATFEFEDNRDDEDYISTPKILESVTIEGVLSHFDFSNTNLTGVSFADTSLKHINFEGADLDYVDFSNTNFESSVSFKNANLTDVDFRRCRGLENVDFEGATLNKVQYDDEDTRYFVDSDFSGKSLIGHDFSDEDMMGYIFTDADLEDADFRNSYLVGVDFENANLKNANFQGATLTRCNLKNANLENANLEFTNLEWADMKGSDVSFADFTLAKYNSGTILPDSITQSQIDSMTLTDTQEPRTNPNLLDSFENDIDTVFQSYKYMAGRGFGGACVAAAETVFEDVLEHGNLKHPERLEIVAVWNTFCLEKGKPVGHVCLRYLIGEDREDHEAYVYIDSDLQEKEYHDVESWGHMPEYMLDTVFDLEEDASILDGYGDNEEFETTTLSFSNIEDFKNSPSYRMYCNVPS